MRTLTAPGQALLDRMLAGEQIPCVQLVQMDLDAILYLTTANHDIVWSGQTWVRSTIARIEPIEDGATGELQGLAFTISGVNEAALSLALTEPVEGRGVHVWDVFLDPATGEAVDGVVAFTGLLNAPAVEDGPTAIVSVTAEHRGVAAVRAKPSRYTHDEQTRLHTGDTSLDFDIPTDAAALAWPKASFFRK